MSRVDFVDRGADNRAPIETLEVFLNLRFFQEGSGNVTLKNASFATFS